MKLGLKEKRVMVVGLGATGRAVARFLAERGSSLVLVDRRYDTGRNGLPNAKFHLGEENPAWLDGIDLVVPSPGVPRNSRLLTAAVEAGIPVMSEIELASRFLEAPIIAVTGTNGKSTVTVLIGEILKAAGRTTFVGGNLGTPLIEAAESGYEIAVAEVSSYQLEWIMDFSPAIGIHLNISPDHLDRYPAFEEYARAKANLFRNQGPEHWAVLNRDDPGVWKLRGALRARLFGFGMTKAASAPGIWQERGKWICDDGQCRTVINPTPLKLRGRHNLSNAMAAAAAALLAGVPPIVIEDVLARFEGLPHRMAMVRERGGVAFINDSKGTNVGAAVEALKTVRGPVILIAGGLDKGGSYEPLREAVRERTRLVILIGAAREKMRAALDGTAPLEFAPDLRTAVLRAGVVARAGDTVLLSPACSSFDQFKDYAERGCLFEKLVRAL